jgi:hypothetical protein
MLNNDIQAPYALVQPRPLKTISQVVDSSINYNNPLAVKTWGMSFIFQEVKAAVPALGNKSVGRFMNLAMPARLIATMKSRGSYKYAMDDFGGIKEFSDKGAGSDWRTESHGLVQQFLFYLHEEMAVEHLMRHDKIMASNVVGARGEEAMKTLDEYRVEFAGGLASMMGIPGAEFEEIVHGGELMAIASNPMRVDDVGYTLEHLLEGETFEDLPEEDEGGYDMMKE